MSAAAVSLRGMRTLASIAFLVACLVACDAGEKPAAPPKPSPGPKVVVTNVAPDLRYLPADSDFVIAIDVARLRQSKLWPDYAKDMRRLVVPGTTDCAYDPLSDASTIIVGTTAKPSTYTVVVRGIDRDKTLACAAKDELHFVDATTLVRVHGRAFPADTSLANDKAFIADYASTLKKLKRGVALTVVSRPGSKSLAEQWQAMGTKLVQLYGSIDLTDELVLHGSVVLGSLTEATNLASVVQSQRQNTQIKSMFDRFDVIAQGSTLNIDSTLGEPKLANLSGVLRAMIPAD